MTTGNVSICSWIHAVSTVQRVVSPHSFQALYSYVPQNEDELELREGDLVHVMEKCDDGWFVGTSQHSWHRPPTTSCAVYWWFWVLYSLYCLPLCLQAHPDEQSSLALSRGITLNLPAYKRCKSLHHVPQCHLAVCWVCKAMTFCYAWAFWQVGSWPGQSKFWGCDQWAPCGRSCSVVHMKAWGKQRGREVHRFTAELSWFSHYPAERFDFLTTLRECFSCLPAAVKITLSKKSTSVPQQKCWSPVLTCKYFTVWYCYFNC